MAGRAQFLESYKSVTLASMARAFGVSVDFIDRELVDFIVAGRLPAKIDKARMQHPRSVPACSKHPHARAGLQRTHFMSRADVHSRGSTLR